MRGLRLPGPAVVIAPCDGHVIRFADAEVMPRVRGGNRCDFVVRQDGHPESIYQVDGRLEVAAREYRAAVESDPGMGRAHFELARVYLRLERFTDALPHPRRAVEVLPDDAPSRQMLQDLMEALGDNGGTW